MPNSRKRANCAPILCVMLQRIGFFMEKINMYSNQSAEQKSQEKNTWLCYTLVQLIFLVVQIIMDARIGLQSMWFNRAVTYAA